MGGHGSKHKVWDGGSLYIDMPHMTQIAGEMVTGTIFLDMHHSYPGRCLEIEVEGNEKAKWTDEHRESYEDFEGNTQWRTTYHKRKEKERIFKMKQDVYYFADNVVPQGQY
jgi:hypothetical protein